MKVTFDIKYSLNFGYTMPVYATIKVKIKARNKVFPKILYEPNTTFFDKLLTVDWGNYDEKEEIFYEETNFRAHNWEELKNNINEYIEKEIDKLKKVKKKNKDLIKNVPKDKEINYII